MREGVRLPALSAAASLNPRLPVPPEAVTYTRPPLTTGDCATTLLPNFSFPSTRPSDADTPAT